MPNFTDYRFSQSKVVAQAIDGQYLWIAYELKDSVCLIRKVSAHDLTQIYFSISLSVTSINAMKVLNGIVYVGVTHATTAFYLLATGNPISSQTIITRSAVLIDESSIAVTASATNVYFLSPGNQSGNNAQIVSFDIDGYYVETIELLKSGIVVSNAISIAVDSSDNLWVVTTSDPTELYRVYFQSGGWEIQQTIFI